MSEEFQVGSLVTIWGVLAVISGMALMNISEVPAQAAVVIAGLIAGTISTALIMDS